MKVKIFPKKKEIHISGTGSEKQILNLIAVFAGGAVKNVNKSKLAKLVSSFIDKIVIDMSHEAISKEFIQLLLRFR